MINRFRGGSEYIYHVMTKRATGRKITEKSNLKLSDNSISVGD